MRLGYFGGSFDPPHLGHLAVARAAADTFALDRVLLVPTANQPLKPAGFHASYENRFAMVSLLCKADPRLEASDLEAPQTPPSPNYTIDTLRRIRVNQPNAVLFVIVGADAFHQLPRWRSHDELLRIADWIVVTRPRSMHLNSQLPPLTAEERRHIHQLTTVDHPASATAIRDALWRNEDLSGWLSPELVTYIRSRHLYA